MAAGQGFASLKKRDPERLRELCSRGGKKGHMLGTAYEWTHLQAREAGRKGGLVTQANRRGTAQKGA